MKEGSLVIFTILAQMAVGAFWSLRGLSWFANADIWRYGGVDWVPALVAISLIMGLGLIFSFFHLGSPARAWRACLNLHSSWLSREIFFAALFFAGCVLLTCMLWLDPAIDRLYMILEWGVGFMGLGFLVSMIMAYRLRTIPAWYSWTTSVSFAITTLLLGGLGVGSLQTLEIAGIVAFSAVLLLGLQLVVTTLWILRLVRHSDTSRAALAKIKENHNGILKLRIILAVVGVVLLVHLASGWLSHLSNILLPLSFVVVLISEILGRILFYQAGERYGV